MYLGERIETLYSEDQFIKPAPMQLTSQPTMKAVAKDSAVKWVYSLFSKKRKAPMLENETTMIDNTAPETQVVEKTVYVDRVVEVEKIVEIEKPVYVDRIVEVEKPNTESSFFDDYVPAEWTEQKNSETLAKQGQKA